MSEKCRGCSREYDCADDCPLQRALIAEETIELLERRLRRIALENEKLREKIDKPEPTKGPTMHDITTTEFRPLRDNVLVKLDPREEKTKSGIYIPATVDGFDVGARQGTVLAVGRGRILDSGKLVEPRVKRGDRVCFNYNPGVPVTVNGEEHLLLREKHILGVIEKDSASA